MTNVAANMDDPVHQWLADDIPPDLLLTPLSNDVAKQVIERLEKEFERHWYIDSNRSLTYAERIIAVGNSQNDTSQIAFGTMRKADCLGSLGNMDESWNLYEQAGDMFQAAGDEVGWARTRVGRLYLGPELNRIPTTLAEAEQARATFRRYDERDRLLRLDWQTALVYNRLGDQHRALDLYDVTLAMAITLGEAVEWHIGPLYEAIGVTYNALGDFHQALIYYEQAREWAIAHNQTLIIARLETSIAEIAQAQGYYLRALTLPHGTLEKATVGSPFEAAMIKYHMAECYLSLNRYAETCDLAQQVIQDFRTFNAAYELACTLLLLATAESALGNFDLAYAALAEAEPILISLNATNRVATIRLWRGQMALRQDDAESAYKEPIAAESCFEADGQHRLDQPNLSFLELADGQLYTDDLLQEDLGYELVTLSACETGRANVLASDELIGLARGFLYAGAGALLVSLWRVTEHFMERMYQALHGCVSKAAAVREAQQYILAKNRQIHPAFWGAFQLIGDASPFSKYPA